MVLVREHINEIQRGGSAIYNIGVGAKHIIEQWASDNHVWPMTLNDDLSINSPYVGIGNGKIPSIVTFGRVGDMTLDGIQFDSKEDAMRVIPKFIVNSFTFINCNVKLTLDDIRSVAETMEYTTITLNREGNNVSLKDRKKRFGDELVMDMNYDYDGKVRVIDYANHYLTTIALAFVSMFPDGVHDSEVMALVRLLATPNADPYAKSGFWDTKFQKRYDTIMYRGCDKVSPRTYKINGVGRHYIKEHLDDLREDYVNNIPPDIRAGVAKFIDYHRKKIESEKP